MRTHIIHGSIIVIYINCTLLYGIIYVWCQVTYHTVAYIHHHSPCQLKGTICLYVTLNSVEAFPSLLCLCFIRHEHYTLNRSDKEMSHGNMRVRIHNEVMITDYRRQRIQKLPKERITCKGTVL